MSLDKKDFSTYINQFNFRELFNDMGWNNDKTTQPIVVDNETYTLQAVAEKCGLKILTCKVSNLPTTPIRKKLDTQIRKLFYHYLLIFIDDNGNQRWLIPIKKSEGRDIVTIDYASHQVPEFLYQKVSQLTFTLEQEEHLTIVDVSKLINDNFIVNSEKITKAFYDKFKKEHGAFLQFIKGISDKTNQEWYASLMLNRLMFCYFIQKKGFLDNNKNYLRDKLLACKAKKGKVKFYSFYRDFLLVLFHKGLNEPTQSPDTKIEIGKIPYLNGGLFDEHELEKNNDSIDIDDKAFERLFDFFDQYEWHLDTRHTASGKDINPDVIGYIFEKYINDRANMGAYYTKEDITDYISKNCILPYLFDETKRHYPKAFNADAELWQMVKQSGDQYIYDAVKKGVEEPLPKEIEQGIKDVSKRTEWNKTATINFALPTEIWREVVDRRNRYTEVKSKIDKGDIRQINDFISYNLNIRQFAQDVVENTNDPELLKHFYKALNSVTIIDPTCGSGAFLFAAMNILEPLYESCLQRMENFVAEAPKGKYKFFEETLAQVKSPEHPNLQYFIYKSIILRNLYGVDIMKEAVEIAKLRLFLKLVATVEADYRKPNLGLEPLPDIDFNIRAGNTLVGFATEAELKNALVGKLDFDNDTDKIKEKCDIVARAFERYKTIQLTGQTNDYAEFKAAKDVLNQRLAALNHELNIILCKEQGITYDENNPAILESYKSWFRQYQPFHWFAEFYEILQDDGGFDVIIGNPPYVEYSQSKSNYRLKGFSTEKCGNLYAFVLERSSLIMNSNSRIGMIVPMSLTSIRGYSSLRTFLHKKFNHKWVTNHAIRPTSLFDGISQRVSIFIGFNFSNIKPFWNYTNYLRTKPNLNDLFSNITFCSVDDLNIDSLMPKIGSNIERQIFNKIISKSKLNDVFIKSSKYTLHFKDYGETYWIFPVDRPPYKTFVKSFNTISCKDSDSLDVAVVCFNSSLFYWFYTAISDCWHFGVWHMTNFHFSIADISDSYCNDISILREKLMVDYIENRITRYDKRIEGELYEYKVNKSKPIIDEIDKVLAKHYGFTDEELDFIINYDIKYRMGKELESEDEE